VTAVLDLSLGRSSALLDELDEVIREVIAPSAAQADTEHRFPAEAIAALSAAGLGVVLMPEELGGAGAPTWVYAEAVARVSAACGATSTVYMTQLHCAHPIHVRGTPQQQRRWIPALCSGVAIGAIALTEPSAGSDVASMRTVALRDGDRFIIRGGKTFISNGDRADVIVLFASVDTSLGKDGITAFLLDTASLDGFGFGSPMNKLGQRGASTVELTLDDCAVPSDAVLGEVGEGYALLLDSVTQSRISASAQGVGFAQGAYQATVAWAQQHGLLSSRAREAQDLQFALSGLRSEIFAARSMLYEVCDAVDRDAASAAAAVSMAKLHCTGLGVRVPAACVELIGDDGDLVEVGVERRLRDAKIAEIYDGTSQVQSMLIARDIRTIATGR
jgi:alkylation response protein AidB-like acyl-CoA dehydrogenase